MTGTDRPVSKSWSQLAHVLLEAAGDDISGVLRGPVELTR